MGLLCTNLCHLTFVHKMSTWAETKWEETFCLCSHRYIMSLEICSQNVKTFETYLWKCTCVYSYRCVHSYRSLCIKWLGAFICGCIRAFIHTPTHSNTLQHTPTHSMRLLTLHSYRSLCITWPREGVTWPTFENARVCILIGLFINVTWPSEGHVTFMERPVRMHTRAFSREKILVHLEGQ